MINAKELGKRLLFIVWAIPLGWWFVNSTMSILPASFAVVFPGELLAIALALMGLYEYSCMLKPMFPKNAFWLNYLWLGATLVLDIIGHSVPLKYGLFLLLILVAFEAIKWGDRATRWKRASLMFSAVVFLYIAGITMINFYDDPFRLLFKHFAHPMLSQMGLVSVLLSVFMCDTGAYFVGSLWGKHHYTTISPNKTVEGSIGGLVVSFAVCMTCWWFFRNPEYPLFLGIILGIIIGISAQLGDLLVSLIKRYFKVKNASELSRRIRRNRICSHGPKSSFPR